MSIKKKTWNNVKTSGRYIVEHHYCTENRVMYLIHNSILGTMALYHMQALMLRFSYVISLQALWHPKFQHVQLVNAVDERVFLSFSFIFSRVISLDFISLPVSTRVNSTPRNSKWQEHGNPRGQSMRAIVITSNCNFHRKWAQYILFFIENDICINCF
jgi:hypothetical protein